MPVLEDEIGALDEKHRQFVAVCELCAPQDHMAAYRWCGNGCPPSDRLALCKAYIAKAVWDFATAIHAREKAEAKPKAPPKPKRGKRGRLLKNCTYTSLTPQFWGSCDAVCNQDHWQVWGTPNCGKGQPSQIAHTGHGAAPARFRNVRVGVLK